MNADESVAATTEVWQGIRKLPGTARIHAPSPPLHGNGVCLGPTP